MDDDVFEVEVSQFTPYPLETPQDPYSHLTTAQKARILEVAIEARIEIRPLEVLRETEQTVWVSEPRIDPKPIRMAKRSYQYNQAICDDQKTAAQFIVKQIEEEIERVNARMGRAKKLLEEAEEVTWI